ncbi:ORF951 [White spot syndrome virus]|uniref:ORF951 n=1 Tax=White spot syndrome virus TaxID=342409 RepID=A0A2D3I5V8_9VIRU|nr:ORF951 [White spot syndrome virus]
MSNFLSSSFCTRLIEDTCLDPSASETVPQNPTSLTKRDFVSSFNSFILILSETWEKSTLLRRNETNRPCWSMVPPRNIVTSEATRR